MPFPCYSLLCAVLPPCRSTAAGIILAEGKAFVKAVKDAWLDKFFPTLTKRIYKPYGHNKNLKNSANAILVDDSEVIRKNFKGLALDPVALW